MPRPLATLLALTLLLGARPAAWAEPAWGVDKAEHLGVSLALSGTAYAGLRLLGRDPPALRVAFSVGLALLPGVLKELYDAGRPGNRFSGLDLTWDAVGALSGALVALGVDLLLTRWLRQERASRVAPTGADPPWFRRGFTLARPLPARESEP